MNRSNLGLREADELANGEDSVPGQLADRAPGQRGEPKGRARLEAGEEVARVGDLDVGAKGHQDRLARVDAVAACRTFHAHVGRCRKKHEALYPNLAGLEAVAPEHRVEDLRGLAIQADRALHGVRDVPVEVGLDGAAVRLRFDDEHGVGRSDDRVELVDHAAAFHEPRVTVDREVRRQPFDDKAERLTFSIVGGLAERDEARGHFQTNKILAPGNQIASWSSTRKRPPGCNPTTKSNRVDRRAWRSFFSASGVTDTIGTLEAAQRSRATMPASVSSCHVEAAMIAFVFNVTRLRGEHVVDELAARARELEDLLVRLHLTKLGAAEARREPEQASLGLDVVGGRRSQVELTELGAV